MSVNTRVAGVLAAVAAAGLAACADAPTSARNALNAHLIDEESARHALVCKVGSNAEFSVAVNGGTPTQHSVADGECKLVYHFMGTDDHVDNVVVTEIVPAGTVLDSITKDSVRGNYPDIRAIVRTGTVTGSNSVSGDIVPGKGWVFTFYNRVLPPPSAMFIVIDEDGIDNGKRWWDGSATSFTASNIRDFSTSDVNDDRPGLAQRLQLRFFAGNVGRTIWLFTGQTGDEGWFAPKVIPTSWASAGPTSDGLRNFLGVPGLPFPHNVGPGLGRGSDPERWLDKIPYVTPLRAEGLHMLIGRTVCALVWDSDISMNYGPLNGSLKGEKLGVAAFEVLNVVYQSGFSSSTLPRVQVTIRDANEVCGRQLTLFGNAPEPRSSSEPVDIRPAVTTDNNGYLWVTR